MISRSGAGELVGQGLELAVSSGTQQPATHKFAFDKVFGPSSLQVRPPCCLSGQDPNAQVGLCRSLQDSPC